MDSTVTTYLSLSYVIPINQTLGTTATLVIDYTEPEELEQVIDVFSSVVLTKRLLTTLPLVMAKLREIGVKHRVTIESTSQISRIVTKYILKYLIWTLGITGPVKYFNSFGEKS